jgi:hypothetical protein
VFNQAAASAAAFFRFLRQLNRPIAPRPEAKSGSAAGNGVSEEMAAFTKSYSTVTYGAAPQSPSTDSTAAAEYPNPNPNPDSGIVVSN